MMVTRPNRSSLLSLFDIDVCYLVVVMVLAKAELAKVCVFSCVFFAFSCCYLCVGVVSVKVRYHSKVVDSIEELSGAKAQQMRMSRS